MLLLDKQTHCLYPVGLAVCYIAPISGFLAPFAREKGDEKKHGCTNDTERCTLTNSYLKTKPQTANKIRFKFNWKGNWVELLNLSSPFFLNSQTFGKMSHPIVHQSLPNYQRSLPEENLISTATGQPFFFFFWASWIFVLDSGRWVIKSNVVSGETLFLPCGREG